MRKGSFGCAMAGRTGDPPSPAQLLHRRRGDRELRALRVRAHRDPGTAGHFVWTEYHLTAQRLHRVHRLLEARNLDVRSPAGLRRVVATGEHPAERFTLLPEDDVGAVLAHVVLANLLPVEQTAVELQRLLPVVRRQVVPRELTDSRRSVVSRRIL